MYYLKDYYIMYKLQHLLLAIGNISNVYDRLKYVFVNDNNV